MFQPFEFSSMFGLRRTFVFLRHLPGRVLKRREMLRWIFLFSAKSMVGAVLAGVPIGADRGGDAL